MSSRIYQNRLEDKLQHQMLKGEILTTCYRDYLFMIISKLLIFTAIFVIISVSMVRPAKAEDAMDTVLKQLENLTCEVAAVGNLFSSEFSHTCIPASFFTFVVANIVSPGPYASVFLRLNMNDEELFPEGACKRANRIDYNDQKLSFYMCNNRMLMGTRVKAVAETLIVIAKSAVEAKDPWDEVVKTWSLKKKDYHEEFLNQPENAEGIMIDFGVPLPVFPWKVIKENDKMCVATKSFGGWIPVGCKYIKEPFPISIYADFLDVSEEGIMEVSKLNSLTTCGNMGSCYRRAYSNSKAAIVMTGPLIECVKEMVAKLMVSNAVCSFDDVKLVLNSSTRETSALYQFQKKMHLAVSALLTIYVILFGFRIVLSGDVPPKSEIVNFVIKFLFVTYFSVGININPGSDNDLNRMDGMIQWAFPFLLDGMNQLAGWIINASPSELCKFSDVTYPDNLRHMQLWDSLDCRISHYLGLDVIQTLMVENATRNHDFSRLDILSYPIPPYIYLIIPAVISGYIQLVTLALMYPLLVISVGAFVVNATVVCMISVVVLGVLAPLFVPMYLFNYTKGYFEAWVKLLISFMLQPMVAVVFMTTMMAVYDFGFYGTCQYTSKEFSFSGAKTNLQADNSNNSASTASSPEKVIRYSYKENDLQGGAVRQEVDNSSDSRSAKYFYVDQDWSNYRDKNQDLDQSKIDGCKNSLGFMLNNPFQFLFNTGESIADKAIMPWIDDASGNADKARFDFLGAVASSPGMFFKMVEVIYEKIRVLVFAMLTACFTLYLMYHFSAGLAGFAADMTEGVSLGNMAIKPQTIFKAGMQAASMAGRAKGQAKGQEGGQGGGGSSGGSGPEANDQTSSGRRLGGDKISTGGGSSGASDKVTTTNNSGMSANDFIDIRGKGKDNGDNK